jgi:tetratricopeptide (TPR) repeat protein
VIHAREGNVRRAAAVALALVINNIIRLQMAPAAGWLAKTRRHLAGEGDCVEQGWLAMVEGLSALAGGQDDEGLKRVKEAFAVGERYGDPDLRALGLVFQGVALTQLGRLVEAAPFFDEAMAIATDGELGPMATGLVYCRTICACLDCFDYRRALEWTDAIHRVSLDNCTAGFHGDCRTHRASIDVIRGEWAKGESEARIASEESEHFDLGHAGIALHEVGIVRLRSGDLDGADAAFRKTVERGVNPQPGLALLQLARGDGGGSLVSIKGAIGETPPGSLKRARLLSAAVDIAEALGDAVAARNAAGELAAAADKFATSALQASAAAALGVAAGMKGDTAAAVAHFRQACSLWLEVDAPYEVARIRARLGAALLRLGDTVAAGMELDAAAATFRRLGAEPDARGVERLVSGGA